MSSFFAGLFSWGASAGSGENLSPPRGGSSASGAAPVPTYSLAKLHILYDRLSRFRESDLEKQGEGDALIETVRQITEALIWGEQNNSQFFDFFCEKSIFSDLVRVLGLKRAPKKVKLQLLQTLSILVQNIKRQTSVYYILSNNHVNRLMTTAMDFEDEEMLAYYITLMKSLAMRLDSETIKFFFIQHPEPTFPLYIEAAKFFSHKDNMVRASVRTITLQVYRIEDLPMRRFVLRHAAQSYFSQLAYHLRDLWLRLDASAANMVDEDDLAGVQRDNELQQDLQIYLSDVFELGIPELNEVLADRLLNGAILPVLLAGLVSPSSRPAAGASMAARTLAPQVALFLIRQVLDTFHSPVLLEPLVSALLWPSVPAALAYVLPWCPDASTSPKMSAAQPQGDFVANPLRDSFFGLLRSSEDGTFLMATSVVHACVVNRTAFSRPFLESAGLLPSGNGTSDEEDSVEPLTLLLEALGQRTAWRIESFKAFVCMILDVIFDENADSSLRLAAVRATESAARAAAYHARDVLRQALAGEDGGAWLVDVFCEEWELHKAAPPNLSDFFADPRRLLPPGLVQRPTGAAKRPSLHRTDDSEAQRAVRSLLVTRRLLRILHGQMQHSDTAPVVPLAEGHRGTWSRCGDEPSPLQLQEEASSLMYEGQPISLSGDVGSIECSVPSQKGKRSRFLLLNPLWLAVVQPDPSKQGAADVTTAWPVWQVQSLVDRSDPRTLQLGMTAYRSGMSPGEAVAYNPPVSTYFTLALHFEDVTRCHEAAVHLSQRRRAIRLQMLQKASSFVEACCASAMPLHSEVAV